MVEVNCALMLITYSYLLTLPAEWRIYRSQSSLMGLRYATAAYRTDTIAEQAEPPSVLLVYSSF